MPPSCRFATTAVRGGVGILLLGLLASALWDIRGTAPVSPFGEVLFALILLPAAWSAGRTSRRHAASWRAHLVWRLVALSLTLVAVENLAQGWYQLPVLPLGEHLPVWPILLAAALACHEAGHAAAAQLLGLSWKPFARLPWVAGIAVTVPDGGLPPRDDLLVALAGPLGSFALAAVALPLIPELAGLSAILGVLNLIPFLRGSDGWRALHAARQVG